MNSSSKVLVFQQLIIFAFSTKLWLMLMDRSRNRSCNYDDDGEEEDDDDSDEIVNFLPKNDPFNHHREYFLYRRDTSLDFHPNSCNWNHFENPTSTTNTNDNHHSSLSSMESYTDNSLRGKKQYKNNDGCRRHSSRQ